MNIAVLGAMWGDEGKGHITHHFSRDFDWVIRFNGGANAGHTIYRDGVKFVHNLLPSVDFRVPTVKAYLGAGMVIDLKKLRDEVYDLEEHYPGVAKRIYVDREAFMVLDEHKDEDKSTNAHIGSTNRGIGPAYRDKVSRKGIRIDDLYHPSRFFDPYYDDFMYQLAGRGVHFVHQLDMQPEMETKNLLFEGAQGVLLDINHGIYPYVSCSDATIGGIYASGFGFAKIDTVYGVAKCYTTKVGEGPFPTELQGEEGEKLRKMGNEFGATTGRPRRVGWLDLPALKYACQKGGINKLILTKFDILNGMDKVPLCVSYDKAPTCPYDFFEPSLKYKNVSGWTDAKYLPRLESFIKEVEGATAINVDYISCGTNDEDILRWRHFTNDSE
jgi:adenylosuccinate synthase